VSSWAAIRAGNKGAIATPNNKAHWRRAAALASSVMLHVALLALGFSSATGALVSGGEGVEEGDKGAIAVTMVSAAPAQSTDRAVQVQNFAFLYRQVLAQQQAELYAENHRAKPQTSVQALFDAADRDGPKMADQASPDTKGVAEAASATGNSLAPPARGQRADGETGMGPGAAASTGALWGQIEPCWRNIPDVSLVPVTLEITLDENGRITSPPIIHRPNTSTPDEHRLIAEARALAAIAACVPYHDVNILGDQRRFTVNFQPTSSRH